MKLNTDHFCQTRFNDTFRQVNSWPDPTMGTDVYFKRALQSVQHRDINPWVRRHLFCRAKRNGDELIAVGMEEIAATLEASSDFFKNGGRMWAVPQGYKYTGEKGVTPPTLVVLEGWLQDHIALETIYLGQASDRMTKVNMGIYDRDFGAVGRKVASLRRILDNSHYPNRFLDYFGARHYDNALDPKFARAALDNGATGVATEGTSYDIRQQAKGTIPHASENVFTWDLMANKGLPGEEAWKKAVVETVLVFDEAIDEKVPRVTLCDYAGYEITNTLQASFALNEKYVKLEASRLDTNGAVVAEGALDKLDPVNVESWLETTDKGILLPPVNSPDINYWIGKGVTVTANIALKLALMKAGLDTGVYLTSGMRKEAKLEQFILAERMLHDRGIIDTPLFCGIGVGEISPGLFWTDDIVAVGKSSKEMYTIHKKGRPPVPNSSLVPCYGDCPTEQPTLAPKLFSQFSC